MIEIENKTLFNSETYFKKRIYKDPNLPGHKFEVVEKFLTKITPYKNNIQRILITLKHILPNGKYDKQNMRLYNLIIRD